MSAGVLVVGGGLGGHKTCAALRAAGYDGPITLFGSEECPPYDRPPHSKGALHDHVDTTLAPTLDEFDVTVRLGEPALGVDLGARLLRTALGEHPYDDLVVATGADPVAMPGPGEQMLLRNRADSARLRSALVPGTRVTVIGAGWIGAEVSTAALARGCEVVCLEAGQVPLMGPLGQRVGTRMADWWSGVDLRCGRLVRSVEVGRVELTDGTTVPADVVVTAVGVRPTIGWLDGSGLKVAEGGIAVDGNRRSSDPHVYAVGDAAARWSSRIGARVHSGHWDEAITGPAAVAAAVVGTPKDHDDVPYFWSDQFGRKVQYLGQHSANCRPVFRESTDPERWGVAWLDADDRMTAHLSVSTPRAMLHARTLIEAGAAVDAAALTNLHARPTPAQPSPPNPA